MSVILAPGRRGNRKVWQVPAAAPDQATENSPPLQARQKAHGPRRPSGIYIYIYIYIFKNKKKQKTNGLLCSVLCVLCGFQSIQGTNYKDLCTYFGGKAAGGGCDSGSTGHCSMHRAQPILSLSIRQQMIGPDAVHLENKIQQKIKIGIT
jgi:hypothetical protein